MKNKKTVIYCLKGNRFDNPTKEEIIKNGDKFSLEDFEKLNNNGTLQCGKDSKYFVSFVKELLPPDYHTLRREVEEWFHRTFNYINIDVLRTMSDLDPGHLDIRYPEEMWIKENYIYNISDSDRQQLLEEYFDFECVDEDDRNDFLNLSTEEQINDYEFSLWIFDNDKFESYLNDRRNDHYPMWNTCFEFKERPSEEIIQVFMDKSLVIIEETEHFNTAIGVAGAGFDFYDSFWIPIYLNLPYNEDIKEYYKPLNIE